MGALKDSFSASTTVPVPLPCSLVPTAPAGSRLGVPHFYLGFAKRKILVPVWEPAHGTCTVQGGWAATAAGLGLPGPDQRGCTPLLALDRKMSQRALKNPFI